MKKILFLLTFFFVYGLNATLTLTKATQKEVIPEEAVYLGVENYNQISSAKRKDIRHYFWKNGEKKLFSIKKTWDDSIQNVLAEGYVYELKVKQNEVISAKEVEPLLKGVVQDYKEGELLIRNQKKYLSSKIKVVQISKSAGKVLVQPEKLKKGQFVKIYKNTIFITAPESNYLPPVKGLAGVRTLKNFLKTALEPVGTSLYIYGGSWDWQDKGGSLGARTIGLSPKIVDFFNEQGKTYSYINKRFPSQSYYPHQAINQYYYAGMDCSGYVGWSIYNLMNTENGKAGYVEGSNSMAKNFANKYHFGTFTKNFNKKSIKPGDIFSMPGHVWICVGGCEDGSFVILHSTPSSSVYGYPGGGVQLSAIGENRKCEAYQLADYYMKKYYPKWSDRYPVIFRNYKAFTAMKKSDNGKFSWYSDKRGLLDPEGLRGLGAKEVLKELFGE